ncbi:hypothetical protein B0H13DRAFT_2689130 [Mycena leptocephala]|nr:hypothetical protein B0H13DRAFT_2689130 [Mycena leptocephala]
MPTLAAVHTSNATWTHPTHPLASSSQRPHHPRRPQRPSSRASKKPLVPDLTRAFLPCDLIANAKCTAAALRARFPHIHFLFLSASAVSFKGSTSLRRAWIGRWPRCITASGRSSRGAAAGATGSAQCGGGCRVAALHTAGRGGPVDLDDLGLVKGIGGGLKSTVDTPLLRTSPSAIFRAVHYVRFLIFPTLMFRLSLSLSPPISSLPFSLSLITHISLFLAQAPPGASRTGGAGEDIGLGGAGDATWDAARAALGKHSEGVVGGAEV